MKQNIPNQTEQSDAKPVRFKALKITLTALLLFLAVLLPLSVHWALSQFANLKMDEIVYELSAPLAGTGNGMIGDYLLRCLLPALLVTAAFLVCAMILRKAGGALRLLMRLCVPASLVLSIGSVCVFASRVGLFSYVRNVTTSSDFIENNYADPAKTTITFPDQKRNLIFIYLESMEDTFSSTENGGAFDVNYIPNLTALAQENEDFSGSEDTLNGGYSLPGTTWTIAGMFATSSGLPLKSAMEDNSMSSQKSFFPELTTLGDILQEEGYNQCLMFGSNATFGGRRQYYQDHGDFDIEDYNYALDTGLIPEDYEVFWGYEDEKLFSFAKDKLTELSSQSDPFNLTMLTVDTHMPSGYTCELCENEYGEDQPYANAVACSDRQVSAFISWIQEQDFYENTTIVITGDHPTMATGFCDDVPDEYVRKTYTCIINGAAQCADPDKRRTFTTFDLFPTSLAALGAQIEGDRLGLGTNLYSATETLSEQLGYDAEAEEVSKNSPFLTKLETLDSSTQAAIDAYASTAAPQFTVDADSDLISVTLSALPETDYEVSKVFVKLWRYDGEKYVHSIQYLEQQSDGSWAADVETYKAKKFTVYDSVLYQMYATLTGVGSISIGEEGTLEIQ